MANNDREIRFQSTLAPLMEQFIEEKHACGYRYHSSARLLASFDRFLAGETLPPGELPRPIIGKWLAKKPHESALNHQRRISIVRQFALFMCRLGYRAYVPDRSLAAKNHAEFSPSILTQDEVEKILQAVDHLPLTARSPLRHLIMPEVFRLLYGCGFRLNEVLQLRVRDVDLNHGILTVRRERLEDLAETLPEPELTALERVYLRPEPLIQSDHERIRSLAESIVSGPPSQTPLDKARRLMQWVHLHIEKRPVLSMPDALSTLENRMGDCNEHAMLLAALARAAGIPARVEAGLVYLKGKFYYHAWNLLYVGRWVTADAVFGQLPADVTHLRFVTGSMQQQLNLAGVIGNLTIDILDPL